jgi:hypothetical protein
VRPSRVPSELYRASLVMPDGSVLVFISTSEQEAVAGALRALDGRASAEPIQVCLYSLAGYAVSPGVYCSFD